MSWECLSFKEVFKIHGGNPSPKENEFDLEGVPFVKMKDLGSYHHTTELVKTEFKVSDSTIREKRLKVIPKGSILIPRSGSVAQNHRAILSQDSIIVSHICALEIINPNQLNNKFAYYYLTTIDMVKITKKTTGLDAITFEDLSELIIPLPPLATQKHIAEILDAADALKRKDQQLLKKYDELAQAIFIDMFGDPVKNEKGWEVKKLVDVTTKIGSGSTPTGGKTAYKKSGISLIRSMNVYDFSFKWKDLAFIDDNQAKKLDNVTVQSRDVLFNITGASVCRCSIVPDDLLPARVNQHVAIIRTNEDLLNPIFLNHFLVSERVKNNLLSVGSGGGAVMEAITKEQLESYKIIIPPIEIQNHFEVKINLVFGKKKIHNSTDEKTTSLFNTLIQKAFNGDLVN